MEFSRDANQASIPCQNVNHFDMDIHCKNQFCTVRDTGKCHRGHSDPHGCANRLVQIPSEGHNPLLSSDPEDFLAGGYITWGRLEDFFRPNERMIITLVGESGAGKTTFLGLLYLLLLNGKNIPGWHFHYCYTLKAWESLAQKKRYIPGVNVPQDQDRTSILPEERFLHLTLFHKGKGRVVNLLFPDPPGEHYTRWALNIDDNSIGSIAQIIAQSHAFILLIDCALLAHRDANRYCTRLEAIIARLAQAREDQNLPIATVWAKADCLPNVLAAYRNRIEVNISRWLPDAESFRVSRAIIEQDENPHEQAPQLLQSILERITMQ